MTDPKPLLVLWSKAAVRSAGVELSSLQKRLITEAGEIALQAGGWFLHTLPDNEDGKCFLCTGNELPHMWKIFVKTGIYKPFFRLRDDHPDLKRRGQMQKFPEAIVDPDNEEFGSYEDYLSRH
jgi:hypothetical protein